ncbi:MAG: PKD domain-containing protein [Lentisphaerae bacterium]|jgi:hypothetical protein|nr:PKD domain-containing protein [Lentisphaerota bacterium]
MKQLFSKRSLAAIAASVALCATATDYYVNADPNVGSDENVGTSEESAFATIDCAVTNATESTDTIHVAAGTYTTTTQWGPNLKAKLIGEGETRDAVTIQSSGTYRTLRMAAGSWLENVTVVGEGTYKADRGGAIEMSGGTVTNCVVRDGTAKANGNIAGGNLYVNNDSALVVDCEIYGGSATNRGGNVYLDKGVVRSCTIYGGVCPNNVGGNVYQYQGTLANCVIYNGTANNDGGNVRMNGSGVMQDCVVSNGTVMANEKKGANVYMDSSAKMSRCRLVGGANAYGYNGGSLCVYSSSASVEDCLIEGSDCGGVLLGGTSYLYNCTIVGNDKYGCWSWSNNQHFFNVVIFGNESEWNGNLPNNDSAEFVGCASSGSSRLVTDGDFNVVSIGTTDFADYANGDYTPASEALIDAGTSDPRGASASMTDIAGNPRLSGTIDIGCYEYQKTELVVRIDDATPSPAYAPSVVTFKHTAENSETQVTFTYNYGDGSDVESTTDSTITHTYQNPGVYTVTITASNGQDEPATMVYNNHVQIASTTIYVTPGNGSGTFPYNTPESGFGNFKSAVQYAADGYTLLLGEGVHETVDQVSFNKALTIRGLGASPEAVIVRNTVTTPDTYYHRVLEVNNGDAFVSNLTLENGCVRNQNGGNLRLVLGVVSNCVIRGGLAVADNGNAAGAAVEISGAGMLTHCVVSNNVVQGTSNSGSSAGGAIYFPWAAKNGQISNCLIAYNRYVTSGEETKSGAAGIRFNGGNEGSIIENNTIVANTVEGSLADDSAAIHCTTYRLSLRNNILFGNTETGKGKYTTVKLSYASDNAYSYHNNITDDAVIAENGNKSKNNILVTDASKLFKNYANGDFRPSPNGAAYNRGTTEGLALLPAVDLGGGNRVKFSDKIDIGCYESQNRPGFVTVIR